MSDLRRWGQVAAGPFRFGERKAGRPEVVIRRRVYEPGPDGPVLVGVLVSRCGGPYTDEHGRPVDLDTFGEAAS